MSKRNEILDAAQNAILAKGFAATSIDEIIETVGVSKNGFFYHFADKNALAHALLERYIAGEDAHLDDLFDQAGERHTDPRDVLLSVLQTLAAVMDDLPNGHPGCLVATVAYSERLYDRKVRELNRAAVASWRSRFLAALERVAAVYHLSKPIELFVLADMISSTIEGGIILSRAMESPAILGQQLLSLVTFFELLFAEKRVPSALEVGAA